MTLRSRSFYALTVGTLRNSWSYFQSLDGADSIMLLPNFLWLMVTSVAVLAKEVTSLSDATHYNHKDLLLSSGEALNSVMLVTTRKFLFSFFMYLMQCFCQRSQGQIAQWSYAWYFVSTASLQYFVHAVKRISRFSHYISQVPKPVQRG